MRYTDVDIKKLCEFFPKSTKQELLNLFPGRPWSGLRTTAYRNGCHRPIFNPNVPKNNFYKLLEHCSESFYWVGYLLADGTMSKSKQLAVASSMKDKEHLNEFANFIGAKIKIEKPSKSGYSAGRSYCRVSFADKKIAEQFSKKFGFYQNKTFNPPSCKIYEKFPKELLLSIIIGFIDGDGCIYRVNSRGKKSNTCCIQIKIHQNWFFFLEMIKKELEKNTFTSLPQVKILKSGYSSPVS